MICRANQLTSFFMMATLVFNELKGFLSWYIYKKDKKEFLKFGDADTEK